MPVAVIKDVAEFHSLPAVDSCLHQAGLTYDFTLPFQFKGEISVSVITVPGQLTFYPLDHIRMCESVLPCIHDLRLAHDGEQRLGILHSKSAYYKTFRLHLNFHPQKRISAKVRISSGNPYCPPLSPVGDSPGGAWRLRCRCAGTCAASASLTETSLTLQCGTVVYPGA